MNDRNSTKRLAIRGVLFNWIGRLSGFLISFVVTPILVRGLGNEAYGIWSIVMTMTAYYALADLGLRGAGIKFIAQYAATDDWEGVNKVTATCLAAYTILALCLSLVVVGVAAAFPFFLNAKHVDPHVLRTVVLITGLTVIVGIPGQIFSAMLAALKRFDLLNALAVTSQFLQSILIVAIVWSGHGLVGMAVATLLVAILSQLVQMFLAIRSSSSAALSRSYIDMKVARDLFRFSVLNLVQGLGRLFSKSAGTLLIGVVLGPAQVTFFSIAETLTRKSAELSRSICTVLMPVASQLDAQDRREDLARALLLCTSVLSAMGAGLSALFICLGAPLIDYWIGEGYAEDSYPILCVLSLSLVVTVTTNGMRSILRGTNRMNLMAWIGSLEAVATLVFGIALLATSDLIGMAYAILVAQLLVSGFLLPFFGCQAMKLSLTRFINRGVLPGLAAAVPATIVLALLVLVVPPSSLLQVALQGAIGCLFLAFGILFVCFERETRSDILSSVMIPLLRPDRR